MRRHRFVPLMLLALTACEGSALNGAANKASDDDAIELPAPIQTAAQAQPAPGNQPQPDVAPEPLPAGAPQPEPVPPGPVPPGPVPPGPVPPGPVPPEPGSEVSATQQAVTSALYRLNRREFENAIRTTFGIESLASSRLPPDVVKPFDTDQSTKEISSVFFDGFENVAFEVAKSAASSESWLNAKAGCLPSSAGDHACFSALTRNLGLELWREPMAAEQITALADNAVALATDANNPAFGTRLIIQSLLLSPQFVYRLEVGTPDQQGLVQLGNYQLLSKLSFLIWGVPPTPDQLAQADTAPFTRQQLETIATEMLADPMSANMVKRFHELWLGFKELRVPAEMEPMLLAESEQLLSRVLDNANVPWNMLFLSPETYVTKALAEHYGISGVESEGWVEYQNPKRAGILSHGAMMSLAARNTDDTSVTIRGKLVAAALLCRVIPDPPPDVDVDDPPEIGPNECKSDSYVRIRESSPRCSGCHTLMDPVGEGLEQFDGLGRFRETEAVDPNCRISGEGQLVGVGEFNGPKELAELMLSSRELTQCAIEQYLRFSNGYETTAEDRELRERLHSVFLESGEDFDAMILAYVKDPVFRARKELP